MSDSEVDKEKPGPINPTMEEEEEEEERVGVAKGNRRTRQIESSSGSDNDEGQEKAEEPASRASSPLNSSPVSQSRRKSRIQRAESSEGEDGQELPDIPRQVLHSDSSEDEGVDDPNPAPRKNTSASSDSSDVDTAVHDKKGRARQRKQADNKKRASRKSKAAAMLEIHAESSRMLRDSELNLPYHRPKQRSLAEFLARKKNAPKIVTGLKMNSKQMTSEAERLLQEREKITKEFYKNEEIDDQGDGDDEEDQDFAIPSQFVGSTSDDNKVGGAEGSEIPSTPNSSAHPPDAPSNSGPAVPELPDIVPETAGEPDEILGDAATESFHLELEPDTEPMDTAGDIEKTIGELEETMGEPEDFIAGLVKEAPKAVSAEGVETHGGALENESETVEDKLPESESLRLVLEDDTEKPESDGEEMVCIDTSIIEAKEKKTSSLFASKRLAALGSEYDVSVLQKSLDTTPKLGAGFPGSDDLILDAPEPSKQEKGLSDLMDRFVKHAKASHKKHSGVRRKTVAKEVNLTIVRKERDADGNEQLKTEDISYTSTEVDLKSVDEAKKSEKPGAQHLALKQTLKEKIWAKKREERKKKEEQKRNQNGESFGDIEDEEEELLEDEFDDEENESEEEDSEENEEVEVEEDTEEIMKAMDAKQDKKKLRIKSAFADDEAQEEDVDEDELGNLALEDSDVNDDDKDSEGLPDTLQLASEEEEEEDAHEVTTLKKDSSTSVTQPPAGQTESGISASIGDSLPAFSQMEGESDIPRWTPFDERTSSLDVPVKDRDGTKAKKKLGFSGLLDDSDAPTDNLDDVIGLCSGQFATQNLQSFPDQTPDTVINTQSLTQSQLETQDTVILEPAISKEAPIDSNEALENEAEATHAAKFLDSDDEDVEQKKKTKKRKRIVMSDDSDDADSESKEFLDSDAEDNDGYEDEEDAMEKAVNYDSDENIVEEPQEFKGFKSKKGGLRKEFLEREAELSGSDVDSGDEDEKGLDRMEMEEGDLDDLDEDEVREQVEKIHQKQILDQDQREIKLFQEAFLEDGELHSDQARARKFKWLGADETEELERRASDNEEEEELNEEDEKRRITRLEREKWLKESKKADDDSSAIDKDNEDSPFFKTATKAMKRLTSREEENAVLIPPGKNSTDTASNPKLFKEPSNSMPLQLLSRNQRGSFLSRNTETLDKISKLTKGKANGSKAGAGAKNTNKFVFTALSPKKDPWANLEEGGEDVDAGPICEREQHDEVKKKRTIPTKRTTRSSQKQKELDQPSKKRQKRSLDEENSLGTIFGLM